jgi:threonine dehydratase
MIGGSAPQSLSEHIYEVIFPERPSALADFLHAIGSDWNISLFHYRNAASDSGKVLIGFEAVDTIALETKFETANVEFTRVTENVGIRLFVQ